MKRFKQKFSRALVLLLGACLLLTSCSEDLPVGESSAPAEEYPGYNGVFTVTLDGKEFSATHLNCPPAEESVVLYTKAYENEGTPVLTLSGTCTGRTAITVRAETEGGITEYSVSRGSTVG